MTDDSDDVAWTLDVLEPHAFSTRAPEEATSSRQMLASPDTTPPSPSVGTVAEDTFPGDTRESEPARSVGGLSTQPTNMASEEDSCSVSFDLFASNDLTVDSREAEPVDWEALYNAFPERGDSSPQLGGVQRLQTYSELDRVRQLADRLARRHVPGTVQRLTAIIEASGQPALTAARLDELFELGADLDELEVIHELIQAYRCGETLRKFSWAQGLDFIRGFHGMPSLIELLETIELVETVGRRRYPTYGLSAAAFAAHLSSCIEEAGERGIDIRDWCACVEPLFGVFPRYRRYIRAGELVDIVGLH